MQSNNPVFRRSEEFNGTATANQGYSDPATWGTGAPTTTLSGERMTIDSVVQKTGFSLAIVVATAIVTWVMTGDLRADNAAIGRFVLALTVGSLGAFVMSMVNSFKREISPILVMIFAAFEGVALGALSKFFDAQYADNGDHLVSGAVLGTFAAFAGTLAAYKFFNISVSPKFRKFVVAAMFGMVGLALMEFVLGLFGASIGLFDVSGLGMFTAFGGLLLGVFMLIMDFDFVENGVAAGLPEKESWRAAFAITVSLVWIYTNLLRILAFFSQD